MRKDRQAIDVSVQSSTLIISHINGTPLYRAMLDKCVNLSIAPMDGAGVQTPTSFMNTY